MRAGYVHFEDRRLGNLEVEVGAYVYAVEAIAAFVAAAGTAFSAPPLKPEFPPIQKLNYAEQIIEKFYVDTVNSNDIVEAGIVAMLKKLDPHSTYTNPEETRELTEPLQGNFSGIGIQFNMLNDTLYVVQTVPGRPL